MNSFKNTLCYIFLALSLTLNAQNRAVTATQSLDEGTIENQFDYLIKKSNRYQEFKVVKRVWLDRLKKSVNDSLISLRKELKSTQNILSEKELKITELTNSLSSTNENVKSLNNEKDNINFFGTLISKSLYNTILWSIIGVLILGLVTYIIRFNRSNSITKEIRGNFADLEQEFESHRQRALEREQQIRRKLQDEINKQRKD